MAGSPTLGFIGRIMNVAKPCRRSVLRGCDVPRSPASARLRGPGFRPDSSPHPSSLRRNLGRNRAAIALIELLVLIAVALPSALDARAGEIVPLGSPVDVPAVLSPWWPARPPFRRYQHCAVCFPQISIRTR
jgi:hypothetical protein